MYRLPEAITYSGTTARPFLRTILCMESNTRPTPAQLAPYNPLSGWEAATRWNAATWDWMAQGFRQWMALMTTVPARPVAPLPQAQTLAAPAQRPLAQAEPKRPPRVKTQPTARPKAKTRTRG